MDQLEKYIKENINQFNDGPMPQGHKEMFKRKLKENNSKNVHRIGFARIIRYTTIAVATIIIAFIVKNISIIEKTKANDELNYAQIIKEQELEILNLTKDMDPNTFEEMESTMNIITYESIPLSEQLPDEMEDEEKIKILREYYKQKSEALKRLKLLYAEQTNVID